MHFVVPKHLCKKPALFQTPVGAACSGTLTSPEAFKLEATSSFQVWRENISMNTSTTSSSHLFWMTSTFKGMFFPQKQCPVESKVVLEPGEPGIFWPAEVEKKGKVLDLSFQETSEKHIWIHPREYQNCELLEATKPWKRWNLGTSGLPFANIQEAGKFYGCPTRNIWIRCF